MVIPICKESSKSVKGILLSSVISKLMWNLKWVCNVAHSYPSTRSHRGGRKYFVTSLRSRDQVCSNCTKFASNGTTTHFSVTILRGETWTRHIPHLFWTERDTLSTFRPFFGYYHLQEKTRAQSLFCRAEKIYIFMVLWLWKCYCFAFVTICYNLYYYVTRVVTLNVTRSNRVNVTWTGEGDVKTKMQNLINDYERKWPSSDIRKPVLTQI